MKTFPKPIRMLLHQNLRESEAARYRDDSLVQMEEELHELVLIETHKHEIVIERQATQFRKRIHPQKFHHKQRSFCNLGFCIDYVIHASYLGRFFFALFGYISVLNYSKDIFVAIVLLQDGNTLWFWITLAICLSSCRLLLMFYTDLESMQVRKLCCYLIPGSVCLDFKLECDKKNIGTYVLWELLLLLGACFMPVFLFYLATRKALSLFGLAHFSGDHTLAFNIVELLFETIPQLGIQIYLGFYYEGREDSRFQYAAELAIGICLCSLVKIPLLILWNRSLINGLTFTRHHKGIVKDIKFHPSLDILASGGWDTNVIFHTVLTDSVIKAKRVAPCGSMQINCIAFSHEGTLMAVGGHGLRLYSLESKRFVKKLPKRTKGGKRPRGAEITHCVFSGDDRFLFCAEGAIVNVYDMETGDVAGSAFALGEIPDHRPSFLGCIQAMTMTHDGKFLVTSSSDANHIEVFAVSGPDLKPIHSEKNAHDEGFIINCMEFTRDNRYLLTGSTDSYVKMWSVEKNMTDFVEVQRFDCGMAVLCLAIGCMMTNDGEEARTDELHSPSVEDVSYCSPPIFGQTPGPLRIGLPILVVGGDNIVVWELEDCDEPLAEFRLTFEEGMAYGVDVSPYGDNIAVATDQHNVLLKPLKEIIEKREHRINNAHQAVL